VREVTEVGEWLRDEAVRLLTLTGPGGVGKTQLALAAARRGAGGFAGGAFFFGLPPLTMAGLLVAQIGQTLGVREAPGQTLRESLVAALANKRLLLVLDNFEQVVAGAPIVADLLAACPALTMLVTSRERLRLRLEREYPVLPLAAPSGDA